MRFRRIATISLVLLCLGLGLSWVLGSLLSRPSNLSTAPLPRGDFYLVSSDGMKLAASYRPGPTARSPAVLLLHPKDRSRHALDGTARWLRQAGYATLAIDLRGHGQSTATPYTFGWNESRDALAAFHWLKRRQHGAPIAVFGISLGGAAALLGDHSLPADALILQSVYGDIRSAVRNRIATVTTAGPAWVLEPLLSYQSRLRIGIWPDALSPRARLATYRGPVLVMGGEADRFTPPAETRALYRAAPGPKRIWLIPGTDHAASTSFDGPAYRETVLSFLRTHLR